LKLSGNHFAFYEIRLRRITTKALRHDEDYESTILPCVLVANFSGLSGLGRKINMAKLKTKDIQKVIQFFDNELVLMQRVSRIEKMKMRRKIVNIVQPALNSPTMTPEIFMHEAQTKLVDVIKKFMDGYSFQSKLAEAVRKLYEKAEASSKLPPPADK
jgi:hypothetical protein